MKFKLSLITVVIAAVILTSILIAAEKKVSVKPSNLPATIKKAVDQAFPDGKIIEIEKEVEGKDTGQYDVIVESGSETFEVEISPNGKIKEIDKISSTEALPEEKSKKWTKEFHEENCTFSSTGSNRFFILEPGYKLVLKSKKEKVIITVTDKTRKIGDIETRVIQEYEEEDGELKEISRNFFAICKEHGDVFYFGEDVDDYENGKIVKHSGAWRADEKNSKAGIIMPGTILLGARHYQEIAPNAMDRAEIIADDITLTTPGGTFKNCIKVEETSGLDPKDICYKIYAPGVGLIQDEDLVLTEFKK
ncbi:MAG: hypothetical protein FVQ82_17720 [Planctomycetes bacterium]|nr:hypothetical protein [Planctomycetota bacterium]